MRNSESMGEVTILLDLPFRGGVQIAIAMR
jgi:hypothetical protein